MTFGQAQLDQVAALCRAHGVARLAAFSSRVSDDARADSDFDLPVEFAPGCTPGTIGLPRLAETPSAGFEGVEVDLRMPRDLSRHFRERVLKSAEELYAA